MAFGSVQGVVVKVDTAPAIVAQEQLRTKTSQVFVELEKQSTAVVNLEKSIQQLGSSTQRTFGLTKGGVFAPEQFTATADAAKKASQQVQAAGASANAATSFFGKLSGAVGGTGAARGFGLVTTAIRALSGSLNPLGIAVGVVSGALLQMVLSAGKIDTALEKVNKSSREAFESFTALASARERLSIGSAAIAEGPFGGQDPLQERVESMAKSLDELERLRGRIDREGKALGDTLDKFQRVTLERRRAAGSPELAQQTLGAKQIQELFESLGRRDVLQDLETAAQPDNLFSRNEAAREARLKLEIEQRISFQEQGGAAMTAVDANRLLTAELDKQRKALHELNVEIAKRNEVELRGLATAQQRDAAEEGFGPRERAALSAVRANREKIGRPFTLGEIDINEQTINVAQQLDREAESAKEAAKAIQECTQAEKQRQDATKNAQEDYEKAITTLQNEAQVMGESEETRKKLKLQIDLNSKAQAAGIPITLELALQHEKLAEEAVAAEEAGKALQKIENELGQEHERLIELEKRRVETLAGLNEETDLLLATTKEQQREARVLVDLNRSLRELEVSRDSRQGKELEAAIRRNAVAKEYRQTLEIVADKSQQIGEDIGGAFARASEGTGSFVQNLNAALRELIELEGKRAIIALIGQAFRAVGAAAFASIFGGGATPPVGRSAIGAPAGGGYSAMGSVQHHAAAGLMVDRWGVVNYGNRSVGVGEGGGAKPEAIMPLQRGRHGELGIGVSGWMGGTYVANFPGVRTAEEAARTRPTQIQVFRQIERMQGRYTASMRSRA